MLVIVAVVSYRSTPRILGLAQQHFGEEAGWVPHFTSVINWTLRLGLGLLNQVKPIASPWLAIIDHSIDVGTKKALVVLRVRLDIFSSRQGALKLSDCECIGLEVSEIVNGEQVSQALSTIFAQSGAPVGIIKDCDATLNKGVRLYSESVEHKAIVVIDDLSHVMATALKKDYEHTEPYNAFTAWTQRVASQLRQTKLSFLIPPKLRKKGRFMSLGRLGKWGRKVLNQLNTTHQEKETCLWKSIQSALSDLDQHQAFIDDFARTTSLLSSIMEKLKNQGLKPTTYQQCQQLAEKFPHQSGVKKSFLAWLDKHIALQKKLNERCMNTVSLPISSDVIESLFGRFKHINERNPQADMNRSVLVIPVLCGTRSASTITQVLQQTPHIELQRWDKANIPYTMRKNRRDFLKNSPKSGECYS